MVVEHVSDRTFLMHLGGKIEITSRIPLNNRDDLPMAYTPGVACVSVAIHDDVEKAWSLTIKGNTVAVVSDGSAVLGLGVRNVVVCDVGGALYVDRPGLDPIHTALAAATNPNGERGTADEVLRGADVLVGVSRPGAVSAAAVRTMAARRVVFAMADPQPEVPVEAAGSEVAIMATGRSDYPNQINNVLAFPGVFRGALDVRAAAINDQMKLAAAQALADRVADDELHAEYIIPSVFNRDVAASVAAAVAHAAQDSGVARRPANANEAT